MADEKITDLPAATSVSGADLLPVVQGGVTKKAAANLLPFDASGAAALRAPLLTPTATKTGAYTAAVGELAVMNVAGGATALTLPTAPADRSQVGFIAVGATTGTSLTVSRGGSDTIGTSAATSITVPLAGEVTVYQYDASNTRWLVVSNVKPLTALDARYDAAGAATTAQGASLQKSSNLSDLASASTSRTNLGLGTAATQATSAFDAAGAAAAVLPTQTGNSGRYLTTNGTAASWGAVAGGGAATLTPTATKTAAYAVAASELAMMNVPGGAATLTLPTAPADRTQVGYRAIGATTTIPLAIVCGGTDTIGTAAATSVSVTLADEVTVLQYDGPNTRWLAVANVKSQASLDGQYGSLREVKRRRPRPLNLVPSAIHPNPPTKTLSRGNGASVATVSAGGTGYVVGDRITLTGGVSVYATILQVTTVSAGVITGISIVRPGIYTTNPTSPVAQGTTTGTGTGATFSMTYTGSSGSSVTSGTTNNAVSSGMKFIGYNGTSNISASGYYGSTNGNATATWFEWTTDAAALDVRLLGYNTTYTLFVDGRRLDDTNTQTDSSGFSYQLSLDWSGVSVPRTYRIVGINTAFGGVNIPLTALSWKPAEPFRPFAWVLGDSYTFGTGANMPARSAVMGMGDLLGIDVIADGIGGTGWLSTAGNDPSNRVVQKLATLSVPVDIVFLDMGYNDSGGNMTTLATNFDATIVAIRNAAPQAQIIVFGPATPLGSTTNLDLVKTALSGRAAAWGIPFVDVSNWINSTNKAVYTSGDNIHPNQAGHDYLAARRAQVVAGLLM